MAVGRLDIRIKKGANVAQPIQVLTGGEVEPLPVGTTAKMQIRTTHQSEVVQAELTTENGRLLVDAANALVTITLTSAYTAAWTFERGVYDLFLTFPEDGGDEPIVEGKIYVMPSVTRS